MAVKKRERKTVPNTKELDAFVNGGGTLVPQESSAPLPPVSSEAVARTPAASAPAAAPAKPRQARKPAAKESAPAWVQRAETEKKTEGQPLRYNRAQARLLAHAKAVEGRDYSKILADLIWPALEERYGKDVPHQEEH